MAAPLAMGSSSPDGRRVVPIAFDGVQASVFAVGQQLKVRTVAAPGIVAMVVHMIAARDASDLEQVDQPVHLGLRPVDMKGCVPVPMFGPGICSALLAVLRPDAGIQPAHVRLGHAAAFDDRQGPRRHQLQLVGIP
jgi:hypothetical protein